MAHEDEGSCSSEHHIAILFREHRHAQNSQLERNRKDLDATNRNNNDRQPCAVDVPTEELLKVGIFGREHQNKHRDRTV